MINNDRIVPVTKTDLLSLYAAILLQDSNNSTLEKLTDGIEGDFAVATNSKKYLADQPVKTVTFGASITACTLYFVAADGFGGFEKTGATLTITKPDEGILEDGTLYKAALSTNALTITKVGL